MGIAEMLKCRCFCAKEQGLRFSFLSSLSAVVEQHQPDLRLSGCATNHLRKHSLLTAWLF